MTSTGLWPGRPYRVEVAQEVLDDLRERLVRTRFPREQAGPDWATGTPIDYMRRLRDYWLERFDWRVWENRINSLEQRLIDVDGVTIHLVIKPGVGPDALPILMTNGWPSSFLELLDVADRLANPEQDSERQEDTFTVIIPSLPGYGFSPAPARPLSPDQIARLWSQIMPTLGFGSYVAFGSDWGSLVTARLALSHGGGLRAVQLTSPGMTPYIGPDAPALTEEEIAWTKAAQARMHPESGYQLVQGTKPQSLAYGHTDSPIALAAWIVEKFHGWTVPGVLSDPPFAMDDLIANIMLYWLNGAVAPMWLYGFLGEVPPPPSSARVAARAGFLFSPKDLLLPPPRSWLNRLYDVDRVTISSRVGHFPGMDAPEFLADEIRTFMRTSR